MSLIGLDLNASRARAVAGPRAQALSLLCLDGDQTDLPLALGLEGRHIQIGRTGLSLTRRAPHLACLDFLPHLATGKLWAGGSHRLDADRALGLVFSSLAGKLSRAAGTAMTVPGYLSDDQIVELRCLASAAKINLLGTLPAPLAAVLAAYGDEAGWPDPETTTLVVDADGYALTWSVLQRQGNELRLSLVQPSAQLGKSVWLRKLQDGVSHRCVRQSRRDPRESAETDQALYEQLHRLIDAPAPVAATLRVQGSGWYHNLNLVREDLVALVAPVLRQAIAELDGILTTMAQLGKPAGAILTSSAAGLPGLALAVESRLGEILPPLSVTDEEGDLGDLLVNRPDTRGVLTLPPDALARAAHALALRIHRGEAPSAHPEGIALPAMSAPRVDPGPARLSFRGQDHPLINTSFVLGRDPSCDLVFESELYPHVSGRHCAILFDHRSYTLHDYSRHGTFVNDRPVSQYALHSGDWIRLGPQGPLLRFLGQGREQRAGQGEVSGTR
jgi:hypothetical protein